MSISLVLLRTAAAVRETGAENDPLITLHQLLKEVHIVGPQIALILTLPWLLLFSTSLSGFS